MQTNILALDIGTKRIGMAIVAHGLSVPRVYGTIANDDNTITSISSVIGELDIATIVVGLPRNLQGEDTKQTEYCRQFAEQLEQETSLPVVLQDEALTSERAEDMLKSGGKDYSKADIDAMSAYLILTDYMEGA